MSVTGKLLKTEPAPKNETDSDGQTPGSFFRQFDQGKSIPCVDTSLG